MEIIKKAGAADVKRFFEYPTMQEFKEDWVRLNNEEKDWFRQEVGKIIAKEINQAP